MIQSEAYKMRISGLTTVRKKAENQSQYCRHKWINFLQDANQNKKLKSVELRKGVKGIELKSIENDEVDEINEGIGRKRTAYRRGAEKRIKKHFSFEKP